MKRNIITGVMGIVLILGVILFASGIRFNKTSVAPPAGTVYVDISPSKIPGISPTPLPVMEVTEKPEAVTPRPRLGDQRVAELQIPKLGKTWSVNEGVRDQDFKNTPSHFPVTALPGEVGNFSVIGHRVRKVFLDIDKLNAGDKIVVSFRGKKYTYSVIKRYVVPPSGVDGSGRYVLDSDPGGWGANKYLTLVSCIREGNQMREIVHAVLVSET